MSDFFDFQPKMGKFAVMGNPVEHSRSPDIHRQFALQNGIKLEFQRVHVDGGFDQAVSHFQADGGTGLNITVPFKVEAWHLCNRTKNYCSGRAEKAQAVNTLRFEENGAIFGDNTDGHGFVRDIQNNIGCSLLNKSILIVGAGGAVRGILQSLLDCQPAKIFLSNRTLSKAHELARQVGGGVEALHLEDTGQLDYDIIVNGTTASLYDQLPPLSVDCINNRTIAYDMVYSQKPTIFIQWALEHGAAAAYDGIGMLVEQAAASFFLWHAIYPDTLPVIESLRNPPNGSPL